MKTAFVMACLFASVASFADRPGGIWPPYEEETPPYVYPETFKVGCGERRNDIMETDGLKGVAIKTSDNGYGFSYEIEASVADTYLTGSDSEVKIKLACKNSQTAAAPIPRMDCAAVLGATKFLVQLRVPDEMSFSDFSGGTLGHQTETIKNERVYKTQVSRAVSCRFSK